MEAHHSGHLWISTYILKALNELASRLSSISFLIDWCTAWMTYIDFVTHIAQQQTDVQEEDRNS